MLGFCLFPWGQQVSGNMLSRIIDHSQPVLPCALHVFLVSTQDGSKALQRTEAPSCQTTGRADGHSLPLSVCIDQLHIPFLLQNTHSVSEMLLRTAFLTPQSRPKGVCSITQGSCMKVQPQQLLLLYDHMVSNRRL